MTGTSATAIKPNTTRGKASHEEITSYDKTPHKATASCNEASHRAKNVLLGVSTAILVLLAVLAVGTRVVGLSPYVVLSGSMEPTYPVGSLVYVAPVDAAEVQVGQVITFAADENTVVTHRVIGEVPQSEVAELSGSTGGVWYRTQGDANASADAKPVNSKNIIGSPVLCVPFLGYVSNFLHGVLPA